MIAEFEGLIDEFTIIAQGRNLLTMGADQARNRFCKIRARFAQAPPELKLAGAINVPVQSVCPAERISHDQLPTNPVVTAIVLQAIGPGPLRRPTAADCSG